MSRFRLVEKGLIAPPALQVKGKAAFNRSGSANSSSKLGSDGRSLGRSSDSSSDLGGARGNSKAGQQQDKLVSLHESLAAELREKLKSQAVMTSSSGGEKKAPSTSLAASAPRHAPLLLPPKDYDTVHRNRYGKDTPAFVLFSNLTQFLLP